MTDQASSPLDQILEAAQKTLLARHAETLERAGRVRAALDAYVNALAAEIAVEFATKNGLPAPPQGQSPIGAALGLRAAIEALPELRSRASAPTPSAPTPPPSSPGIMSSAAAPPAPPSHPTVVEAAPPPPPPPKRSIVTAGGVMRRVDDDDRHVERPRSSDLDPLTVALIRDLQSLDLARMPQHQFRIWAEELAARARSLQDKGADPDSVPGRVIRKLTAIAYEKGIGDIFGLNRKHAANWDEVAERARVRREQILANASVAAEKAAQKKEAAAAEAKAKPPAPPPAAEETPPSSAKVESTKKKEPEPEPDSAKHNETPQLRSLSRRAPVVFVGGVVKQEKVALIQQKYGIDIEWVDTSRHGTQAIAGVEKRIRERRLTAVVVLQGLIGHKHFEPLVAASRQVGTPFAYADKAGLGSVARAFAELEKQLDSPAERAV